MHSYHQKSRSENSSPLHENTNEDAPKLSADAPQNASATVPDDPDDSGVKVETDPIVAEHGPLLFIEENKISLNLPALAAKYAQSDLAAYSAKQGIHYRGSKSEGIWIEQTRSEAMRSVGSFLKTTADQHEVPHLLAKRTPALAKNILTFVEGLSPLPAPPSPELMLVPVANGVLDLSGREPRLRNYRLDDGFTNKLPWKYDPQAKCERFLNDLIRPSLPGDDLELLQRDFGRQLVPGNRAQTISIIVGDGGSGKSVLVSIHERIIGIERVAHLRSKQLTGRFETNALRGKCLAVGKDVAPDYLNNAGAAMLKSLTGADLVETEQKYGGKFSMRGTLYVIITANRRPIIAIQDDGSAWRRRLVVYIFTRTPPDQRMPSFDEVLLREEGAGIFAWYVQGFMKHKAELEQHGRLVLNEVQQRRVDDLLMESDAQREFLRANVVTGVSTLSVEEIWQAYSAFARERGWRIPSKQVFCTDLAESMLDLFGVERDNHIMRMGSAVRGYKGVKFAHDALCNPNGEVCQ